jgi:hypothetical protein
MSVDAQEERALNWARLNGYKPLLPNTYMGLEWKYNKSIRPNMVEVLQGPSRRQINNWTRSRLSSATSGVGALQNTPMVNVLANPEIASNINEYLGTRYTPYVPRGYVSPARKSHSSRKSMRRNRSYSSTKSKNQTKRRASIGGGKKRRSK